MKCGSWQGKELWVMIRTLVVTCASFLDCSHDTGNTAAEKASDEMLMGAVQTLCEFSLLVSQLNHCDLFLTTLDDVLKQFCKQKGAFQAQKMSKSAKAKVDELLARESLQLRDQKIHEIHCAMEVQLYGAKIVDASK
jgi:hypothetical protein